jgi:hypothetical protein
MAGSFSTTVVTYTPTWGFAPPWIPASNQDDAITFHLNATAAASSIPMPFPTEIVSNGTAGGTLHFDTATPQDSSAAPTVTGSIIASEGTESPLVPASLDSLSASAQTHTDWSTGKLTSESPSVPANTSTQTSPTPAATIYTNILASKDHRGLSIGQTAGLAIGCVAVGAAIATLVACVLVCRRGRAEILLSARSIRNMSAPDNGLGEGSPPIVLKRIEKPPSYVAIDMLLARPTSDQEVVAMFTQINNSIADYVRKYADGNRVPLSTTEHSLYQRLKEVLGQNSLVGAQKLTNVLRDNRTRAAGLYHLLAWSILQNIRSTGAPETTLLPLEISECISSMTGMQGNLRGSLSPIHQFPLTVAD